MPVAGPGHERVRAHARLEREGAVEGGVGVGEAAAQRVEHGEEAVGGAGAVEPEHDGEQAAAERLEQLGERVGVLDPAAVGGDLHEHAEGRARTALVAGTVEAGRRELVERGVGVLGVAGLERRERRASPT